MLVFEIKARGLTYKALNDYKFMILFTIYFMQVLILFHYAFATETTRVFLQLLEEGCRTLIFFFMMGYFIKQAKKLLPHRTRISTAWQIVWPICLAIYTFAIVYMIVVVDDQQITDSTICESLSYIIVEAINLIMTILFYVAGFMITKRINEQKEAADMLELSFR